MNSLIKLKEGNCFLEYYQQIDSNIRFSKSDFEKIWKLHPKEYGKIKLYGKEINTPRYFQNFGEGIYKFSNVTHESLPIPEILVPLIDWVNNLEELHYNGILVNWYENCKNYISFHSDDERSLIKNSKIYCFSIGADRDFVVQSKIDKSDKYKFKLSNNSLVKMCGECQTYYKHSIPKISGKKAETIGRRISITIRAFK